MDPYPQDVAKFQRAVVTAVSLSCLLTMDYVPKSKPPKIEEMTRNELPRILSILPDAGSSLAMSFKCPNPAMLLKDVTARITDLSKATDIMHDHGHQDMVFSALQYIRKPPTATAARIQKITRTVAKVLEVPIPNDFDDFVGDAYEAVHGMLIRV
jgi:hypothetical protein